MNGGLDVKRLARKKGYLTRFNKRAEDAGSRSFVTLAYDGGQFSVTALLSMDLAMFKVMFLLHR